MQAILDLFRGETSLGEAPEQVFATTTVSRRPPRRDHRVDANPSITEFDDHRDRPRRRRCRPRSTPRRRTPPASSRPATSTAPDPKRPFCTSVRPARSGRLLTCRRSDLLHRVDVDRCAVPGIARRRTRRLLRGQAGRRHCRPTRILGPAVQVVADGYDWLAEQAVDGESPLLAVPATPEELRAKVDLVHHAGMMAHVTYTSIMTLATAAGPDEGRRRRSTSSRIHAFIEDAQRRDVRITQCITDAKGDRSPPARQAGRPRRLRARRRAPATTASSSAAPSCTSPAPRSATS